MPPSLKLTFKPVLTVYKDDAKGFAVVAQVKPGDVLSALGSAALVEAQIGQEGQWLPVRTADKTDGWIEGQYVERATRRRTAKPKLQVKSAAPVLSGDLTRLESVATVPAGQKLDILEPAPLALEKTQAAMGYWLRVRTQTGTVGWIDATQIASGVAQPDAAPEPPPAPPVDSDEVNRLLPNPDDPRWVERIVTSPGPTNYRTMPSSESNETIIGQVRANDIVSIIEDDSLRRGVWIPLRVKGTVGWVSLQVIGFATPMKPTLQLRIDHYAQSGPGAAAENDCGPAALTAILHAYGQNVTSDSLYQFLSPEKRGQMTGFSDLMTIGRAFNLDMEFFGDLASNAALDNLFTQLSAGFPVIALVNYSVLNPPDPYDGGHFVVVCGFGRDSILFLDPLRNAGPTPVPTTVFLSAWGAFPTGDNPPYSHLVARRVLPIVGQETARPADSTTQVNNSVLTQDRQSIVERARRIAFNITSAFEGSGRYDAFQTYDAGIISYGRFQFTLAASSLTAVIQRYLAAVPTDPLSAYLPRLQARDVSLRGDDRLRELLVTAALHPEMQNAQDAIITERYWDEMLKVSAEPRAIKSPLGLAFLFDMAVQRGIRHQVLITAERELGVPERSPTQDEFHLLRTAARVHRDWLFAQADRDGLPGLKPRGDFWFRITERGDWDLQGDANHLIELKGRLVIRV